MPMRYVLAVLTVALALAGCGASAEADCRTQLQPYAQQINPLVTEWQDALKLAGSTPRASLSPQIASLQAIRRKADAVAPPDCAKAAHAQLVKGMDLGIQGFLDFLAQKPSTMVNQEFVDAGTAIGSFNTQLNALSGGGVLATSTP
jgi:hypothetical protein